MAKNPLPGCPCWYFFMFWPFLVKLSQKKVHWFWKKLWKTITNEIQVPHYNLLYIIQYLLHMDWTQGLTMLVFPSHAASWRVASSFTLTQEYVQNLQSGQAARWMALVKLPLTHYTSPYAACILVLFIIAWEWFLHHSLARPAIRSSFRSFFLPEFSFKNPRNWWCSVCWG